MPPITTDAIILHTIRYGETSKIVRLLTPDLGVQSAMAKGALKPKSKFGGRLQVLSEGTIQLYVKPQRELHTLSEFDVTTEHHALAGDLKRYTAATALAELALRVTPAEPVPEVFVIAQTALAALGTAPVDKVDETGLRALWAVIAALGFAPSLDVCARDSRSLPEGDVTFSVVEGGFVCSRCAAGAGGARLGSADRRTLIAFVEGHDEPVGGLSPKHAAAHRRLLARFVERHVAEGANLKALALWQETT
ncbi:MAG: DNA repair protein RecO [Gemmatimonadales bacterium]|jgi:DNA repair protein RecO (recombination protein O)